MNKPVVYYHLWRNGDWKNVTAQIFSKIVESGLSEYMDRMVISIQDSNTIDDISLHGIPFEKVSFKQCISTGTEWPTLQLLYNENIKNANTPILYLHSKGASYAENHPLKAGVNTWTDGLLYYVVEEFRMCLSMLRTGSVAVGANKANDPLPHYNGNFWWIKSDALHTLPNPSQQNQSEYNRNGAITWLSSLGSANLRNVGLVGFNATKVIPRHLYVKNKTPRSFKNICISVDAGLDLSSIRDSNTAHEVYRNDFNSYVVDYLTYIIDNYNTLPEYTYFVRSSRLIEQCPNILDIVDTVGFEHFHWLSKAVLDCDETGAPHAQALPLKALWEALYPDYAMPSRFTFGAGAQFAVHRNMILLNGLDFYENLRTMASGKVNNVIEYAMERLWGYVFGEKVVDSTEDYDLQVFVFNYGRMEQALSIQKQFTSEGISCRVLDSYSGSEQVELEDVYSYDNIYYSGLWNKAIDLFDGTHMMVITSDVTIPDVKRLLTSMKRFFNNDNCWIYAPNVNHTFWNYDVESLESYNGSIKIVPNTDGMCWALKTDAVELVGSIDVEINRIGFGVDILAAMLSKREGKIVGRDYSITVAHPESRSYNSEEATSQEANWVRSLGYLKEYGMYRNNYAMSFLY